MEVVGGIHMDASFICDAFPGLERIDLGERTVELEAEQNPELHELWAEAVVETCEQIIEIDQGLMAAEHLLEERFDRLGPLLKDLNADPRRYNPMRFADQIRGLLRDHCLEEADTPVGT